MHLRPKPWRQGEGGGVSYAESGDRTMTGAHYRALMRAKASERDAQAAGHFCCRTVRAIVGANGDPRGPAPQPRRPKRRKRMTGVSAASHRPLVPDSSPIAGL